MCRMVRYLPEQDVVFAPLISCGEPPEACTESTAGSGFRYTLDPPRRLEFVRRPGRSQQRAGSSERAIGGDTHRLLLSTAAPTPRPEKLRRSKPGRSFEASRYSSKSALSKRRTPFGRSSSLAASMEANRWAPSTRINSHGPPIVNLPYVLLLRRLRHCV